jgi:hypothetical protein
MQFVGSMKAKGVLDCLQHEVLTRVDGNLFVMINLAMSTLGRISYHSFPSCSYGLPALMYHIQ